MPQYCCVPLCTFNKGGHWFPRKNDLKSKWIVAVKRADERTKKLWTPGTSYVVIISDQMTTGKHCLVSSARLGDFYAAHSFVIGIGRRQVVL